MWCMWHGWLDMLAEQAPCLMVCKVLGWVWRACNNFHFFDSGTLVMRSQGGSFLKYSQHFIAWMASALQMFPILNFIVIIVYVRVWFWCKLFNDIAARTTTITRRCYVMCLCIILLLQMWTDQIIFDFVVFICALRPIYILSFPWSSFIAHIHRSQAP